MMLQLNPPILFRDTNFRLVTAIMAIDYGPDYDTLFLCGYQDSLELWWLPHSRLRMDNNISLGRQPKA